jgi:hypothetical protein
MKNEVSARGENERKVNENEKEREKVLGKSPAQRTRSQF